MVINRSFLVVTLAALFAGGIIGPSAAFAGQADPDLVVILRGVGLPVVPIPPDVMANAGCFETDLFDAKTDSQIGTGIDCLNVLDMVAGPTIEDTAFLVDRTTIFNFPQGRLVARGNTAVVPKLFGDSSPEYTHVVGDVDEVTNNVVSGTNRFGNVTGGDVRLSGIVNMSAFPVSVLFNCVFVIDLD